jgi:putative ABC transport system permease protein
MPRRLSVFVATRDVLRTYWPSAALIIAAGAVALAAVVPVVRLANSVDHVGARLRFSTIRLSPLGFQWGSNVTTPGDTQAQTVALLFQLLMVAAFATLILAALSILSISAARASSRFPEIAVRRAVGASRWSLFSAALAEGGVLGTGALVIGVAAGIAALLAAVAGWPGDIAAGSAGPGVLVGAGVAATIVIGSLFQLFTTPSRRIAEANPQPLELYIPALQLGMGLTVLVASAMLVRHAARVTRVSGERSSHGTVLQLASAEASADQRGRQYSALLSRLEKEPGIRAASLMSPGALVGLGMIDAITTDCGYCADGGLIIKWHAVFTTHHFVSADTFGALGIDRVEGRLLSDGDRRDTPPVAVISETLARRHFQDGAAVGRLILLKLEQPEWYTVVGVVRDQEPEGFGGKLQPRSAGPDSTCHHAGGGPDARYQGVS